MHRIIFILFLFLTFAACQKDAGNDNKALLGKWLVSDGNITLYFPGSDSQSFDISAAVSFFDFKDNNTVVFFSFFETAQDTSVYQVQSDELIMDITSDGYLDTLQFSIENSSLMMEGYGFANFAGYANIRTSITYACYK